MDKIDVVVVTYNRLSLLRECVEALLEQAENLSGIYIINNNSSDGTKKYLDEITKNSMIHVTNLETNVGGAKGFEIGVSSAMKGSGAYVWMMDDDTIPTPSASEALLTAKSKLDNNFGFLCSNVKWKDGSGINIPETINQWTSLADENLIGVKSATFVSLLINKSVIQKVGLPIAEMKIWGDDTEYTTRISHASRSFFVSNSIVNHKAPNGYTNNGISKTSDDRVWRIKYSYRNRIYISRKFESKTKTIKLLVKSLFDAFSCLGAKSKKFARFNNVFIGSMKGFFFNPRIKFPE